MKIYRAEICGSFDSCTEFWEFLPLTDFHTTREAVEKEIAHLKGLRGKVLENEVNKMRNMGGAYFGNNEPHIEQYDLIND